MNKLKSIVIIGTGNLAEIALQYFKRDVANKVVAFSVEKKYNSTKLFCGLPVIDFENISKIYAPETTKLSVLIGPNKVNTVRERIYNEAKNLGYEFVTYISPRSNVWDISNIGENCFIFDGCIVEPETKIGANTIMWSGSIVAHHSIVKSNCFLAPSATISGKVIVEKNCFIGVNATIRDHVKIAENTIVGCGAVIKSDTKANGVYSVKETELINTNSLNTGL